MTNENILEILEAYKSDSLDSSLESSVSKFVWRDKSISRENKSFAVKMYCKKIYKMMDVEHLDDIILRLSAKKNITREKSTLF